MHYVASFTIIFTNKNINNFINEPQFNTAMLQSVHRQATRYALISLGSNITQTLLAFDAQVDSLANSNKF